MRKYNLNIAAIVFGVFCISNAFSNQFVKELTQDEYNIVKASDSYVEYAKREPTLDNLLHTLTNRYERGECSLREVLPALELLRLKKYDNPDVVKSILYCYNCKHDFDLMKKVCVRALVVLDPEVGVALSYELLNDSSFALSSKISVANNLLYWGYDVDEEIIQQGLAATNDPFSQLLANEAYSNYYNEGGLAKNSLKRDGDLIKKGDEREKSGMDFVMISIVVCALSVLIVYWFKKRVRRKEK